LSHPYFLRSPYCAPGDTRAPDRDCFLQRAGPTAIINLPIFLPSIFLPFPLSPLFVSFGYHQNTTGLFVVGRKRREKTIESDCPILTSCGSDIERPETRALPTAIAFSNALDQPRSLTAPFFCPPFFCHSHFAPFRFFRLSPKHNRSFCGWQKTTRKDDRI
jgi:hypothetical protein